MIGVFVVFAGAALTLCITAAPAAAQTKPPKPRSVVSHPAPQPAPASASATSPVCMAETLLACFARAEAALCTKAGADARAGAREPGADRIPDRARDGHPRRRTSPKTCAMSTGSRPAIRWSKFGAATARADVGCGSEAWDDLQVYLRPRDNMWEIVTWRSEAEPEGAPEIPDAFRPPGAARNRSVRRTDQLQPRPIERRDAGRLAAARRIAAGLE